MKNDWPWLTDELTAGSALEARRMFGCDAFYREGKLTLVLTGEGEEPWNGVCACTGRESHAALMARFPALTPHPVLGKWLYVSCTRCEFEKTALGLVRLALSDDPLLGVEPKPKRRKSGSGGRIVKKQKIR